MTEAEVTRPLSSLAKGMLDEIISQIKRAEEHYKGWCVSGEIHRLSHGKWGPCNEKKRFEEPLDAPDSEINQYELLPVLKGEHFEHYELQPTTTGERIIRAVSKTATDISHADFYIEESSVTLVMVIMKLRAASRIANLLLSISEVKIHYDYIDDVPFPIELQTRMKSKGIGSYRIDLEIIVRAQYEPCT